MGIRAHFFLGKMTMKCAKRWVSLAWMCGAVTLSSAAQAQAPACHELLLNVQPGFFASVLAHAYQQELHAQRPERWTIQHLTQADFVQQVQPGYASPCVRLFIQPMASKLRFAQALQGSEIVTVLGESSVAWLARKDLGVRDVHDWVQQAAAQPGHYRFSSGGIGHGMHVATELLMQQKQLRMQHVVTPNSKQALQALLDGQADVTLTGFQEAQPWVDQGRVQLLAVSGQAAVQRAPRATPLEQVDPALNLTLPMALYGVGLDAAQLQHWNQVFNQASASPALQQALAQQAFAPLQLSQPQAQDYQQRYAATYGPIYQRLGLIPKAP